MRYFGKENGEPPAGGRGRLAQANKGAAYTDAQSLPSSDPGRLAFQHLDPLHRNGKPTDPASMVVCGLFEEQGANQGPEQPDTNPFVARLLSDVLDLVVQRVPLVLKELLALNGIDPIGGKRCRAKSFFG